VYSFVRQLVIKHLIYTYTIPVFLANNQLDAQFFFMYIYFFSLHVSDSHVPIIKRVNYINATPGICHSV